MKKLLAIVAIAAFASCNNGNTENNGVDSAKMKDSMMKANEAAKMAMDTAKKAMDTAKAAMDTAKMKMEKK
jgi:hypothetical protein